MVSLTPPDPEGITMAPRSRRSMTEEEFFASARIGVAPSPGRAPRGYTPKPPRIQGLLEAVWNSYTTGKAMTVQAPPGTDSRGVLWTDRVRQELLKAKNFLNHQHRDDGIDIRGLEKADVAIIDPNQIEDPVERAAYTAAGPDGEPPLIEPGMLGVRFTARPPALRGIRAKQASERGVQTRFETKREQERAAKRTQRAAATKSQVRQVQSRSSAAKTTSTAKERRLSAVAEDPFRR